MSDVTLKRIIDLETQSEVDNSVYTIIDSPTGYGKKFPLGGLVKEVTDLKQDFNETLVSETLSGWESGSFNSTNGTNYSVNNYIRNQTKVGVATGAIRISCDSGYKFLLFAWDANGDFVGSLKTGYVLL